MCSFAPRNLLKTRSREIYFIQQTSSKVCFARRHVCSHRLQETTYIGILNGIFTIYSAYILLRKQCSPNYTPNNVLNNKYAFGPIKTDKAVWTHNSYEMRPVSLASRMYLNKNSPRRQSPVRRSVCPRTLRVLRTVVNRTRWPADRRGCRNWRTRSRRFWFSCLSPAADFPPVWNENEIQIKRGLLLFSYAP